jgi:putative sterol carrier protein
MTLDECTAAIRAKVGDDSGLNATLKFDCGEAGTIYVDGKAVPNTVDNSGHEADCTVGIMTGKLKVAGDMSVALRMQRVV